MTLRYEHLLGREFDEHDANCYAIVRDFYKDNYGIELTPYACPHNWWSHGLNLFLDNAEHEGFSLVHENPRHWRAGDVIICAINSPVGNHAAIMLPGGKILHHLVGQRSLVTPYAGMFRNATVATYRHKLVPKEDHSTPVNIMELLPPHVRRRFQSTVGEVPAGT